MKTNKKPKKKANRNHLNTESIQPKLSPLEIIKFIDGVQRLSSLKSNSKSKLISLKIPEGLLKMFRLKCESKNIPYQTQIKVLMESWLKE